MRKTILSTLIASLFAATPAFAQSDDDPMRVQGTGTIQGFYNNEKATDNAKLNEYQDLGNGALSNMGVQGRNSTTWFQGYGENFGRSDQFMFIRGGMYGVFKAGAYLNDIPHQFSSNAFSPYNGIGGNVLTATFPLTALPNPNPPANWSQFSLGYDRRDAGGFAEWQKNSPWYFRVDGNQVTFNGTKPGSGSNGTSPGQGYMDLAIPTNTTTSNWGVEGGYQSGKATLALRWDYAKFDNGSNTLQWTNPFFGGNNLDTTYLAPDNTFNKFTVTGNYRDLPWRSVISARYTWAKTTDSVTLPQFALNGAPPNAYQATLPDTGTFEGEKINQSFALTWTALPTNNLESRVFYYWTKLQNNSTMVEYGNAPLVASAVSCGSFINPATGLPTQTGGNCENELFDYTKNEVGFDLWWKFARGNRLGGGWNYYTLDQNRIDYTGGHQNTLWAEYKNTMFDTVSGRLKYAYTKRNSDHDFTTDVPGGANNPEYLLPFTSAFDMQSSTTNAVKLYLDWTPLQSVGISFEGNWGKTDFDDVTLGRTSQDKQGYFVSGNWGVSSTLRLNAFGDWEEYKYPSNHRYIGTVSNGPNPPSGFCGNVGTPPVQNANCYNPFAPPNPNNSYNWNSGTKDTTWMIGVGADWQALERLQLGASYLYVSNEGNATFGTEPGANPAITPLSITNFDNAKQQYFNLKGAWSYNKNWSITGGYSYMKYSHNDVATNGYTYVLPIATVGAGGAIIPTPASNTSLSYGNGYDAFTDGHANIFFLGVTYKFDAPPLPVAQQKVAEAPKVVAPPPPPPAPAPPPPPPQVQRVTLDTKALFDFDKAVLKPEGKAAIDGAVVSKLAQITKLEVVLVTGHTDPIGTDAYNQKLSERRADAVREYLVSKGVPKDKIESIGMGEKQPVPGVVCNQKNLKEKIDCYAPDRRVEVEVKGESRK